MPTTIPCDSAVVVRAANSAQGVQAERKWIRKYYPGHSKYSQSLIAERDKAYDILRFTDKDGRKISVCFDISGWFGKW